MALVLPCGQGDAALAGGRHALVELGVGAGDLAPGVAIGVVVVVVDSRLEGVALIASGHDDHFPSG
ncbi:hypothetical protein FJZ39_02460 [Candidatus Saccharibacteria bacterium]|nr:hypothetical protein [Candidatus Saccharibacteria bacterium]